MPINIKSTTTLIRTVGKLPNINVPTKALTKTSAALKVGSRALGGFGLGVTAYQYGTGQISGTEATVDAVFGVIGFMGPIGAGISIAYFGGKFLYEYYSDDTVFEKPTGP